MTAEPPFPAASPSRTASTVTSTAVLDRTLSTSLTGQLVVEIRRAVETGRWSGGTRLPSSRALASELGVSRTVVTEAFATLVADGYLESRRGSGTYVAGSGEKARVGSADDVRAQGRPTEPAAPNAPRADRSCRRWPRPAIDPPAVDPSVEPEGWTSFRLCEPDPLAFPDAAWRTAARAAVNEPLPAGYADVRGDLELRRAIATFVARERGFRVSPEAVVVTSGTTQSLDLVARATVGAGPKETTVAFENPGYRLARQIFEERGARIWPLPVDEEGVDVGRLLEGKLLDATPPPGGSEPPALVYTTPSHQFPYGSVLSYGRRRALLAWARENGSLVIEDDYDSEFRFDAPALPALAAVDGLRSVVYLGTFSKSLAPSLRIGYLLAPEPLREAILRLRVRIDYGTSWIVQRALAHYIRSGAFDRHLRRMRRLYRGRRDQLVRALGPLPAGFSWAGLAAGLHATLLFPEESSARWVRRSVERCAERGLRVRALSDFCHPAAPRPARDGLVLGYGAWPGDRLEALAGVVGESL